MNTSNTLRLAIVILAAAILTAIVPAFQLTHAAGPWYVAPGGNDGSSCTSSSAACATINGAIGKANAGDTIYVATGIYTGTSDQVVLIDKTIALSGGWDVTFTAQTGTSIVDGQHTMRGVTVNSGVTVTISSLSVQNGMTTLPGGGIYNAGTLTLNGVVIENNHTSLGGGGIYNDWTGVLSLNRSIVKKNAASGAGGGINGWNVTLDNSIISENTGSEGGGIYGGNVVLNNSRIEDNQAWEGGGAYLKGHLTSSDSAFTGNTAYDGGGGLYSEYGTLVLENSTISGNIARYSGGGIHNRDHSALSLNNVTVGYNTAGSGGGGILNNYDSTVTLRNSILAENYSTTGPDCNGTIGTAGYNLVGNTSDCTFTSGSGDVTNVNARLGQLIGDPDKPHYHPLLTGSPAINAGNPSGCMGNTASLTTDQRGVSRAGRCDIGSYEYTTPTAAANIYAYSGTPQHALPLSTFKLPFQALVLDSVGSPVSSVPVTFTAPPSGPSGTFTDTGALTTTAMTNESGVVASTTFVANGMQGSYTLTAAVSGVVTPANFSLGNIYWYVSNVGNDSHDCLSAGTACATINGALNKPGFIAGDTIRVATGIYTGAGEQVVLLNKSVILSGGWNGAFTIQAAASTIDGEDSRQGIIVTSGVTATVERFIVQNGYDPGGDFYSGGGGVFNSGMLIVSHSHITGNSTALVGGGIFNVGGILFLNNSTVSANTASDSGYGGGGVYSEGSLTLNNSTVSGNATNGFGGGIYNRQGTVVLNNSTVSNNSAVKDGGGIFNDDPLGGNTVVQNTIVAGNTASYAHDCNGAVASSGYNLIGNVSGCTFTSSTGDITNTVPGLDSLEGSPGYHPLLPGSPAINAGNPTGCTGQLGTPLAADQRGFPRFGRCDIGAYELQPIGFSVKTVNPSLARPGRLVTYTVVLTNGGATDILNVLFTDTLPISLTYRSDSITATKGTYNFAKGVITWTGSINARQAVTVAFEAMISQTIPYSTAIVNSTTISGGGETIVRSVTINVPQMRVYLPLVSKPRPGIYGHVTENGLPAAGIPLELRFYDGSIWSSIAITHTQSDGWFAFTTAPSLGPGQRYYVRYQNTTDTSRLWTWHTRELTAFAAGGSVHIGDFDLADIGLLSPANDASVGLPRTFYWSVRSATPSDSYEFNLYEPSTESPYFYTDPLLGYVGSYTLTTLPAGFNVGQTYAWEIWVYSPDGGYGISYETRTILFTNSGLLVQPSAPNNEDALATQKHAQRLLDSRMRPGWEQRQR